MGFPPWTLIGMGASALAALVAIGLALLGQSPSTIRRLRLDGSRIDQRTRSYTGWGFAFILLAFGFFLAGVPLGAPAGSAEPASTPAPAASVDDPAVVTVPGATAVPSSPTPRPTARSGAFSAPETPEADGASNTPGATTGVVQTPVPGDREATATAGQTGATAGATLASTRGPAPSPTASPTPSATATPTASPTPTVTPTPTFTPTPVTGPTATILTSGSTLWIRRSPGGAPLVLARDGDVVLLLSGHANQGGVLWREVSTLDGFIGWVQAEFLQP